MVTMVMSKGGGDGNIDEAGNGGDDDGGGGLDDVGVTIMTMVTR